MVAPPLAGCAWWSTARTAPRTDRAGGAAPGGRRGDHDRAEPDGENINDGCGSTAWARSPRRSSRTVRTPGSPMTATPTAAWPSTPTASVDGDQILTVLATDLKRPAARRRHRGRYRDVQPGFQRRCARPASPWSRPRSATSTCPRPCGTGIRARRRAVRAHRHARARHHRRWPADRLHLLAAVNRRGMPMATAAKMMTKYPQVLVNVRGDNSRLGPRNAAAVYRAQYELSETGRVLVRPSGTEPAIRVMVQAADEGQLSGSRPASQGGPAPPGAG